MARRKKKKKRSERIAKLVQEVVTLESRHKRDRANKTLICLNKARNDLKELYHQAFLLGRERARNFYYKNANTCGKALARALHPRNSTAFIPGIRDKDNNLVHSPEQVAECFGQYYVGLVQLKGTL